MIGGSFGTALVRILRAWSDASKAHQRDLLHLAIRKYDQLEKVHELFASELRGMSERLRDIGRMHHTNGDLEAALREMGTLISESGNRREQGRPQRLALYAEAKVYSEEEFANRRGVFKTVPEAVVRATKECMRFYASYFEPNEAIYFHELQRAAHVLEELAHRMRSGRPQRFIEDDLTSALKVITQLELNCDLKWLAFSRSYYRLRVELAEEGIFAGQLEEKTRHPSKQLPKARSAKGPPALES